jgi:membrane protein implicated in regulation of membrane protease activity
MYATPRPRIGTIESRPREKGTMDDPDVWRWIWLGAAVVLGIGEMATMGFFLLPFAIGALVAGVLAFVGVAVAVQIVAFAVVSVVVFAAFRPLAHRLDQSADDHGVGAKRLVGAAGLVLEDINGSEVGMVRIGAEEWRAVAAEDESIPAGTQVMVREIKGTRAVVEPID